MNYLNPNEISFTAHEPLFDINEADAGIPAYNHPRARVESISERYHDVDRNLGAGALELISLDDVEALDGLAA